MNAAHAPVILLPALLALACVHAQEATLGPRPGDVYREYAVKLKGGNNWRVTDPKAAHPGAQAFLPNPVLTVEIDDLEGAARAEAVIDRWGGHPGTSEKRMRFNGNDWIDLPELATTPAGHEPLGYMYQDNPIIQIPLDHLQEGANTFEGTCGDQVVHSFGWGQWGWYGLIVRVYYGPDKPHPTGRIVSPNAGQVLGEDPETALECEAGGGVARVDFLGLYEGYDENGDGVYRDWHHFYRNTDISGHIGTATEAPFRVRWDTRWVPDQAPGSMSVVARICGRDGTWYVTEPVGRLGLERRDSMVRLYPCHDVPERFWVRAGATMSCTATIPADRDLSRATEAAVHLRTWNGQDEAFKVNEWTGTIGGANHNYAYSIRELPPSSLKVGANTIEFRSATEHHGVEICWPGPALVVRYGK
jgi:hypothetical protein